MNNQEHVQSNIVVAESDCHKSAFEVVIRSPRLFSAILRYYYGTNILLVRLVSSAFEAASRDYILQWHFIQIDEDYCENYPKTNFTLSSLRNVHVLTIRFLTVIKNNPQSPNYIRQLASSATGSISPPNLHYFS